ncbi:MAG: nicotinate-nucleotide adenylyltransferase [Gammaproteobacteria bacterium]|nr:nicotinate-nucleotide adenylyltransferase [Gammaproteobacteria bacterium]
MLSTAIGILGGTFDPVHNGHLRLAIEVREALNLAEIRLVPAHLPNLRGAPRASAAQRLALLEVACTEPGLVVDDRELRRTGVSYSVDTLCDIRTELGATPLCFILGQDAFNNLPRWHRWRELLTFAHLVVATRPGYAAPDDPELAALVARTAVTEVATVLNRAAGHLFFQTIPRLPISATDLRRRVAQGRSIAHLTPPAVVEYIASHHLYHN